MYSNVHRSVVDKVFYEKGIRFIFSTRAKVPWILKEDGSKYFDEQYKFVSGKDEVIRKGTAGYVVSYGEMLYRSVDAVDRLRKEGVDVGLINKVTLNVIDEPVMKEIGATPFVLVAESLNQKTALGSKASPLSFRNYIADIGSDGYMAPRARSPPEIWIHVSLGSTAI